MATALVALLQHGEGRARHTSPDESRPPVYTVDLDAVLRRPRQARALRALRRHSSEGAKVIEACLEAGCCSTSRLREVARDDALLTQLAPYGLLAKCDGVEDYRDVNTNTLFDVRGSLFEGKILDFAPLTEPDGFDTLIDDGVAGRSYLIGIGGKFEVFVARIGTDGAPESYAVLESGVGCDDFNSLGQPVDCADFNAWYLSLIHI